MKKPISLFTGLAMLSMSLIIPVCSVSSASTKLLDGATIVTFGDSLTAMSTWPQDIATNLNMNLVNSGIGGNTTVDALARFDRDVAAKDPDFVILAFGTNDMVRPVARKLVSQVPLEDFRKNLIELITKVRALGAEPILNTCPYLRDGAYPPAENYDPDGGLLAILDTYNKVIREVAAAQSVGLVEIRNECDKYQLSIFLVSDGVHLATLGNKVYTELITKFMRANYTQDPNAARVEQPTKPKVEVGLWTKSLISFDPTSWIAPEENTISATKNADGSISFANSNGKWPAMNFTPALKDGVTIPVIGNTLDYDFTTDGAATNIILFINGSTPALSREYINLTHAIKNANSKIKLAGDDIIAGQTVKGSIKLSDFVPNESLDENGNIFFSGITIFAVGDPGKKVTFRKLTVTKLSIENDSKMNAVATPTAGPTITSVSNSTTDKSSASSSTSGKSTKMIKSDIIIPLIVLVLLLAGISVGAVMFLKKNKTL